MMVYTLILKARTKVTTGQDLLTSDYQTSTLWRLLWMPRTDTLRCFTRRSSECATCLKAYGDAKRGYLAMRAKQISQTTVMLNTGV